MAGNKEKQKQVKETFKNRDNIEELESFLKKKKKHNDVLKKIKAKLNTDENQTNNK